uniref:receptor-type tyrosine-protein phosphatase eta-like isoform X2 n=1 Tax=Monopterus albus TaxID=43700 RepID=UPI0009B38BBE|nr:receptor-type tyrosine-protein phosphatase eta-like isoform X2 [Monopterus albus]
MKALSFRITSNHLLMCVFLSLLLGVPDSAQDTVSSPKNVKDLKALTQNETSITLQWSKVENISYYILVVNETKINVTSAQVTYTVTNLASGTKYNFTVFTVLGNVRSSGANVNAFTAPENVKYLKVLTQSETSITLQWSKVENISYYILAFSGKEINVTSAGPQVNYTVTNLTSGTKYNFTVYTVLGDVRSSGESITTFTAPENVKYLKVLTQSETSVTLQWSKVSNISNYILAFSAKEINVTSAGPQVNYTVTNLTSGTKYNFTVFTVLGNVRSSGANVNAFTGKLYFLLYNHLTRTRTKLCLHHLYPFWG